MAERREMTKEQVKARRELVISKIQIEFETKNATYVNRDDMTFVVNRIRDRTEAVNKEFADKMLRQFNAAIVDVGGGRFAVVKR